jgi:hypothetical protein
MKKMIVCGLAAITAALAAAALTFAAPAHADHCVVVNPCGEGPQAFLAHAKALGFTGGVGGDATIIEDGYAQCRSLAAGLSLRRVTEIGEQTLMPKGYTKKQVDDYIWDAVVDLCPAANILGAG